MAKEKFIPKASVGDNAETEISRGNFISILSIVVKMITAQIFLRIFIIKSIYYKIIYKVN